MTSSEPRQRPTPSASASASDPPERLAPQFAALGSVEFDLGWLDGPGARLTEVVAAVAGDEYVRWAMPDDVRARLPVSGWHRVAYALAELVGDHPRGTSATFAAAAPGVPGRWVVLNLASSPWERVPGSLVATADATPIRLRPARAVRAAGLELQWPDGGVVAVAGTVPQVSVEPHSTRDRPWMPDLDDGNRVLGYLLDMAGQPETFRAYYPAGSGDPLPEIGPGGYVEVPVTLSRYLIEETPPGRYRLHADLLALGLRAQPRPVRLLDGSVPALALGPPSQRTDNIDDACRSGGRVRGPL